MRKAVGGAGTRRSFEGARLAACLRRPELLVFLPALSLAAFWLGGEAVMLTTALGLPVIFALAGAFRQGDGIATSPPERDPGPATRAHVVAAMDQILAEADTGGRTTGCLVVELDDAATILDRHGSVAQAEVLARSAERITSVLREGDIVAWIEGCAFAVALGPLRRIELETMVQLAARIQSAMSPPVSFDATRVYVTASVGFCLGARAPAPTGTALLEAARIAADDAVRNGPGAIRAFQHDMARRRADGDTLREILEQALDDAEIRPHFQPQISTDTGAISGFEALARWHHPERGLVSPAEFLPAIESAGLSERLGERMLHHALRALVAWDAAGLAIPTVAVNFSLSELRNPKLAETLKWELDRLDLTPDRLTVEVLETVVAETDNDIVVRNIAALSALGCGIDLDDFGTGHASITNIRRFAVRRIKIDRSFVTRVDEDREQQKIVSAILSLAERMGLETLAEGVETAAEHAMVAQLGAGHVQGFHLARPMAFEDTAGWIAHYRAHRTSVPRIGKAAS